MAKNCGLLLVPKCDIHLCAKIMTIMTSWGSQIISQKCTDDIRHECWCWWQLSNVAKNIFLSPSLMTTLGFCLCSDVGVDNKEDEIPCRASPWWTRRHPRAPRWDPARSWARPSTARESFDETPFSITSPLTHHPCLFMVVCWQTNKPTTNDHCRQNTLSPSGLKVRSLFTLAKAKC